MAKSELTAQKRNESLNPRQIRSSGKIPATLYGQGMESLSLELNNKEFALAYKKDKNAIFSLKIGEESFESIIKHVQTKTLKDDILNIEFQKIRSDAKIKMIIPVEIIGESSAVKEGGILTTNLSKIEVECLPADIPHSIKIDISCLKNYEDSLTVGELNYPEGVHPIENKETLVVKISVPEEEEVVVSEEGTETATAEAQTSEE